MFPSTKQQLFWGKYFYKGKKEKNAQSKEEQEYLKTIIHSLYHQGLLSFMVIFAAGGPPPTGGKWENYHSRSARSSQPSDGVRGSQNSLSIGKFPTNSVIMTIIINDNNIYGHWSVRPSQLCGDDGSRRSWNLRQSALCDCSVQASHVLDNPRFVFHFSPHILFWFASLLYI